MKAQNLSRYGSEVASIVLIVAFRRRVGGPVVLEEPGKW